MIRRLNGRVIVSLALLAATTLAACGPFGGAEPTATAVPTAPPTALASAPPAPSASAAPPAPATAAPASPTPPPTATVAPPTATTMPTASRAASPATPTARPATPGTPAAPGSPAGSPAARPTVTEPLGLCAVTLPAGFSAQPAADGSYRGAEGRAIVRLAAIEAGAVDTLDDVALPYVGAFVSTVAGYQQSAVTKEADSLRIDFSGQLGEPGNGTIYLRQFGLTVCALTFFVPNGIELNREAILAQLIATLRAVKGVG